MVWRMRVQGCFSASLEENLRDLQEQMAEGPDFVIRRFRLGNGRRAAAFFVEGLVNRDLLNRDFFRPLMELQHPGPISIPTSILSLPASNLGGLVSRQLMLI
jgi:hypothetical protein